MSSSDRGGSSMLEGMSFSHENGSSRQPIFRFMELPREIRDEIYLATVEPWAVFTHTSHLRVLDPDGTHDPAWTGLKGVCLPWPNARRIDFRSLERWDEEGSSDEIIDHNDFASARVESEHSIKPTLGYKASIFHPLLLVNKQVSSEALSRFETVKRPLHAVTRHCLAGDRFICHPPRNLLGLFDRGRLEFDLEANTSMSLLRRLPPQVRDCVHSIVLKSGCLLGDDRPTQRAWIKRPGKRYTPFIRLIRRSLPALREIAIWVPSDDTEHKWYCNTAPLEVADMLADGVVDTVRYLYRHCIPDILETCLHLRYTHQPRNAADVAAGSYGTNLMEQWPRPFETVIEELFDEKTGDPVYQTATFPFNSWANARTVVVSRRKATYETSAPFR